jgi:hypothetical protein
MAGCALLALTASVAYGAEVYRSTDANGVVSYSDRPQGANSQYIYVATPRPPSGMLPRGTAAPTPGPGQADPAVQAPPPPVALPPSELEAQRARNCEIARERQQRYSVAHRLFRTLPNGEREYLSDAEIDDARARAAADVENWCD